MPKNVKKTTFPNPFSLLAPHSCRGCGCIGNVICDRCKNYILESHQNICPFCKTISSIGICQSCRKISTNHNFPPSFTIGKRSDLLDSLIHALKYESARATAKPLAELLDHSLPTFSDQVYLIPLPTINRHIRTRGLDHTLLIAKHLAKLHQNYRVSKLLLRNNNSVQVGTNATTRTLQAKSAYKINPTIKPDPTATFILLDDVWTTGASMKSAIKTLKDNHIHSIVLAILAVST